MIADPPAQAALRGGYRGAVIEWRTETERLRATWDVETVKQLVVGNIAGFAGTAALARTDHHSSVSFACFGVGIVFAILCLYFITLGYTTFITELDARIKRFDANDSEMYAEQLLAPRAGKSERIRLLGMCTGWCAAIAGLTGGVLLFRSLA